MEDVKRMITIYTSRSCKTCPKILKYLETNQVEYEAIETECFQCINPAVVKDTRNGRLLCSPHKYIIDKEYREEL